MSTDAQLLPGTELLTTEGDLAAQMVAGLDRFLSTEIDASVTRRGAQWQRDVSSHASYTKSIEENRRRFVAAIGAVDGREPVEAFELVGTTAQPAIVGFGRGFRVLA